MKRSIFLIPLMLMWTGFLLVACDSNKEAHEKAAYSSPEGMYANVYVLNSGKIVAYKTAKVLIYAPETNRLWIKFQKKDIALPVDRTIIELVSIEEIEAVKIPQAPAPVKPETPEIKKE